MNRSRQTTNKSKQTTTNRSKQTTAGKLIAANENEKPSLWTVLIYMAADNNLKEECIHALTEILRVGQTPGVNIITQFDSGDALTLYDFRKLREDSGEDFKVARNLDGLREKVLSDPREIRHKTNSEMLAAFLENLSVDPETQSRNMIVLSGHGSGAAGDFLNTENPPNALSIPELKSVLESAREPLGGVKIDVLGMDSCLMSMIEVLYEVRDQVKFLVGAEGFERNTGWPYHDILSMLRDEAGMDEEKLACNIVKKYVDFYSPYYLSGVSVDLAACDLRDSAVVTGLITAINKLAQLLRENLDKPKVENAILLAHWRAQSYKFELYTDLWDFCDLLRLEMEGDRGGDLTELKSEIASACTAVKEAIDEVVMISCFSGAAFQHSHGLSIYFPWANPDFSLAL